MPNTPLSRLLDLTKSLANRTRLRILAVLSERDLCVGQVAAIFDIARSTASEHLSALRRTGLVVERREGKFVHYSLSLDARARAFLAAVLPELASDGTVAHDQEMTERILALPHELVCELGRAALTAATPDGIPRATGGRQE